MLEQIDVDLGSEHEQAVLRLDRCSLERAACDVERLVEVVGRSGRTAFAPEHVHDLLAVERVVTREGEQLHELTRLLQPPR